MEENKDEINIVKEKYIQVSESRIKNSIKEYKSCLPFQRTLSSCLACLLSSITAFASYSSSDSVWKWIFLVSSILSIVLIVIFGIISLARKKIGKGTEKWLLDEIYGKEHTNLQKNHKFSLKKRWLFEIINIVVIFGFPIGILLLVFGLNNWNIANLEWAEVFWVGWISMTVITLVFGRFINAFLAYAIFGYNVEDDSF